MKNIKRLSEEVSISTDTLRIWERRYGFPNPARDHRGHRVYSPEQVEELKVIKKLQSLGLQPKLIFALSSLERREFLKKERTSKPQADKTLQKLVNRLTPSGIHQELQRRLKEQGSKQFIFQTAVPLIHALDQGWTAGSISIAREHLISDCLEAVLKEMIKTKGPNETNNRLLFLTLSGERHKLGLLMSAVLFDTEGVDCLILNEELPLTEVPQLARELQVAGVALSFSSHYSTRQTKKDLVLLRELLDQEVMLIAGGASARQIVMMPNFFICTDLEIIPALCKKMFHQAP